MSKKILIADGDANLVVSLEYLMRREGHEVLWAQDGQMALDLMTTSAPDLVLLDVILPHKTGFEVLEALRSNPKWEGVPVIVLTAKARPTDVAKGMALGANAYLTKPFSTQELVARVNRLLSANVQ